MKIPKPNRGKIKSLVIALEDAQTIDKIAKKEETTVSRVLRTFVEYGMEEYLKKNKLN